MKDLAQEYMDREDSLDNNSLLLYVDGRGKPVKSLEGKSMALLNLWGLQNTKGKGKSYVARPDGKVVRIFEGQGQGKMPLVNKNPPEDMYITQ